MHAGIVGSSLTLVPVLAALAAPGTGAAAPIGAETVQATRDSNRAGVAEAFRAVASASTSVEGLHVYVDASSTADRVELGLYSGSSKPGTRLGSCAIVSPGKEWVSCVLGSAVRVTKGTTYWLAVLQPRRATGVIRFRDKGKGGAASYVSSSSSLNALPTSYRAGSRSPSAPASIYADATTAGASQPSGPVSASVPVPLDPVGVSSPDEQEPPLGAPAQPIPRDKDCMPDPSSCGFPDVTTTGVTPGTQLSAVKGTVTLSTAGQVYENKLVTGAIDVTAPNVTIRNVKLVMTDDYYGIRVRNRGDWDRTDANLTLEHVEIDMNGEENAKGIAFNGYTARHVLWHNGSDCAHFTANVTIVDSMCVNGPDANDDGWADSTSFCNGPEHIDGFQFGGGFGHVTLDHNTIRNACGETSAILITNDASSQPAVTAVTVSNNLIGGGGYTLYCSDLKTRVASETVIGNRFARSFFPRGGGYGPLAYCDQATTFSANVWDDTGRPVQ
jgi:hypothetical protein